MQRSLWVGGPALSAPLQLPGYTGLSTVSKRLSTRKMKPICTRSSLQSCLTNLVALTDTLCPACGIMTGSIGSIENESFLILFAGQRSSSTFSYRISCPFGCPNFTLVTSQPPPRTLFSLPRAFLGLTRQRRSSCLVKSSRPMTSTR